MKNYLKTVALLVAAIIYVPLVIDWFMPGNGLHQTTVALGGYGPDALRPLGDFFLWDMLVRLIGWDLCGLGTLSMFGALVSLGLVSFLADRAARGVASLSTGLVCAAFIVTPGFLRAATRPDPLMALLAVPLAGLISFVWALTKSGCERKSRGLLRKWWLVSGSLLLAYGLLNFICLESSALVEDSIHLLWFAVLGVLPHLFLAKRMRRHTMSRRFQAWFFGIWISAIAFSATVAAKSFNVGRASGRLAEQFIANAGGDHSIAADPMLADVYLWTLPPDRRNAGMVFSPKNALSVERYLPTVDLWRTNLALFGTMDRNEPLRDYCQGIFRICGDRLGRQLLDAGDIRGAWTVFRETLDKVDVKDDVAILGLCELLARGYEPDAASLDWLGVRLPPFFSRMKIPERLAQDETENARAMQRAIRLGISRGFVRTGQIGQKLLDLDLLLGDWESAAHDARSILSLDRQNALANTVWGIVLRRQGKSAESEYYFRLAVERAKFLRKQGVDANLKSTLRVLKDIKGLEKGLQMEIDSIIPDWV